MLSLCETVILWLVSLLFVDFTLCCRYGWPSFFDLIVIRTLSTHFESFRYWVLGKCLRFQCSPHANELQTKLFIQADCGRVKSVYFEGSKTCSYTIKLTAAVAPLPFTATTQTCHQWQHGSVRCKCLKKLTEHSSVGLGGRATYRSVHQRILRALH